MNVYIVSPVMNPTESVAQYGVYTTERRALVRQEELARDGVSTVVSEVYLNEDNQNDPNHEEIG